MSDKPLDEDSTNEQKMSRRNFIKLLGAAGAAVTLPSLIPIGRAFGASSAGNSSNATATANNTSSQLTTNTNSIYTFNLDGTTPQVSNSNGSRTKANADNFPVLSGMGMLLLRLEKGGIREPHWHPNASELSYCVKGQAAMTIFSPGNNHDTFTIKPGEMTYVPKGYIHDIQNVGDEEAKFVIAFNNELPQDLGISGSVGWMTDRVMDATFGIKPPGFFDQLNYKNKKDVIIAPKPAAVSPASYAVSIPNAHKFNLEGIPPQIQTAGGTIALGNANSFPILNGLALYSLRFKAGGIREPHWHPNAAELDYVIDGKARITIFSPDGTGNTFEVGPGQIVFIPSAYFHYIENIDPANTTHFLVFFNSERPEDTGISGALSSYSNEVLAAVFNSNPALFNTLPRLEQDVFLISGAG
jgi:oxalate decarboxylase